MNKIEKENEERIRKNLEKLSREAWECGIDIVSVSLKDNQISEWEGEFEYKTIIKAPKWKKLETDYVTIKIV